MKYLKKFETETAYNTFKASRHYITPNVSLVTQDNKVHYNPYVPSHDYSQDYLTFEVLEAGNITFTCHPDQEEYYDDYKVTIQYSLDNGSTWTSLTTTLEPQTLGGNLSVGDKVLVKGNNAVYGDDGINANIFRGTAKTKVYGNIMSLIYGDNFKNQTTLSDNCAFIELFYSYTNLISAENLILPATTLTDSCYQEMFNGCTSLTTAPELPATTLAINCYQEMFNGCTNLTTAPELPVTTLAGSCYYGMFKNCTSLTTAPELPATTLVIGCYENMFSGCTSLTTAPELPATTLAKRCYYYIFRDCTSLNSIKCLATNISANYCTKNWVSGVSANGTFTKAASMTSWTTGVDGIPSGWTVVDAA